MTDAEVLIWIHLRHWPVRFRRQEPLGPYICDFVCYPKRLIVEADGDQHGESRHDASRDEYLQSLGFRILRFWNHEIYREIETVLDTIWLAAQNPPPRRSAGTPP